MHLTRLTDFKPVTEGEVRVTLSGGGAPDESFASPAPARPGLFRVKATPAVPGERRVHIAFASPDLQDSHDLGLLAVHPDHAAAEAAAGAAGPDGGGVVLLKEQQWRSDFGTAVAAQRLLRGSVPATGLLRPSADGEAHVTTPIDGHLRPAPDGFPYTGMRVEADQIIAYLVPKLGGDADVAGLELGSPGPPRPGTSPGRSASAWTPCGSSAPSPTGRSCRRAAPRRWRTPSSPPRASVWRRSGAPRRARVPGCRCGHRSVG